MQLKPLAIADVHVGEPLRWPVYDRHGVLLLKQGVIVVNEHQLHGLLERGFTRPSDDPHGARDQARQDARDRRAEGVFEQIRILAVELRGLHMAVLGQTAEALPDRVVALVLRLRSVLQLDADAALAALQIDAADNGFAERHLHAAALCELIGQSLGHAEPRRRSLSAAALTFDIGFAALAEVLDRQAAALSDGQRRDVEAHPQRGVALLQGIGVADRDWLLAVQQHHERLDGSGYPQGLRGEAIGHGARLLAITDIYSAMIRPRAYRGALQSRLALRDIFLERGRHIDEALAGAFIKEIGIYPPGTFVRLGNGEVAVVTRRQQNAAHPQLRCVLNRDGSSVLKPALRDSQDAATAIIGVVAASDVRCVLGAIHALWETPARVGA